MTDPNSVKCKVWRPDGPPYYVMTCATHEEIAGSLVADGMPESEYWPVVIAGYRNTIRWHNHRETVRATARYAREWVERYLEQMEALK